MIKHSKVTDGIHQLTATVKDILFEGLWEIPQGVTVNSYIVKGEKTALIDGVCGWDGVPEHFFELLEELEMKIENLDYIVINHMEPDHSGWLEKIQAIRPECQIYCTKASEILLDAFYKHTDNINVVKDGDTLDLGDGRVLEFITTPNVHWPDAMMTYDQKSKTLLACDVFGTYGAVEGKYYDDQLTEEEIDMFEVEGVRYYANIVGAFSDFAIRAAKKLEGKDIEIIAPGHGIVWRENPSKIVEDYGRYMAYSKSCDTKEVTVLYGSMYGMTKAGADYVIEALKKYPVKVNVHEVPQTSWGQILASTWTSQGIVLAMPTYEFKMFPPMAAALEEMGKKKVLNRKAFRLGSFGWSGGAQKQLDAIMEAEKMNWSFVEPVEYKGAPTEEDFKKMDDSIKALMVEMGVTLEAVTC